MRSIRLIASVTALTFGACLMPVAGQVPPPVPNQQQQPAPLLTPDQLDTLVAPIALYPDPLLGQVLAASTYPLEVVEAQQWVQQNSNLQGTALMDAARQLNWDPSVQALVAFPDVLATLNRDVRWTTDLGNAFLAQQNDVMAAVQRLRVRAEQNGRLNSTPQQTVTTQTQNGQIAVVIEPANPQTVYVPVYNPEYVWGAPDWGYYPPLWYPPVDYGFGFGPGVFIGSYFPGWGGFGWGNWGWDCGWFGGGLYLNSFFFNHYGFHDFYHGRRFDGDRFAWQHDPYHREGIPYGNRGVASRFDNARFSAGRFNGFSGAGARSFAGTNRAGIGSSAGSWQFNGAGSTARGFAPSTRGFAASNGGVNRAQSFSGQAYRGNPGAGFNGAARGYAAPRTYSYGAPRTDAMPRSYAAPSAGARSFGGFNGGSRMPAGGGFNGGARSFGGFNGGSRMPAGGGFSGGARSFGGGGGGGRSFGGGGGGARSFGGGGGGGHVGGGGGGHAGGGRR